MAGQRHGGQGGITGHLKGRGLVENGSMRNPRPVVEIPAGAPGYGCERSRFSGSNEEVSAIHMLPGG